MAVLRAAFPVFLVLILIEIGVARRRGVRTHELYDVLTDLGCAVLSQGFGVFVRLVSLGSYVLVSRHLALQRWLAIPAVPSGAPLSFGSSFPFVTVHPSELVAWVSLFLVVDLGQYLVHRLSHRVSFLWACHAVHHSSEELNYFVAIRNSSFHGFFIWVFFLPLAVLGVPWPMFLVCYGLNVMYQFWVHTRVVGRLGWLERLLNTPSHHRVHHGRTPKYVNRNYGGVLIIWDRLFGTFQEEEEEPEYGVYPPLRSRNPLWANLDGFAQIVRATRATPDWGARLRAVVGPPEALGVGPATAVAEPGRPDSAVTTPRGYLAYAAVQVLAAALAALALLPRMATHGLPGAAACVGMIVWTLNDAGAILDGQGWARPVEVLRLLAVIALCVTGSPGAPFPAGFSGSLLLVAAASLVWWVRLSTAHDGTAPGETSLPAAV